MPEFNAHLGYHEWVVQYASQSDVKCGLRSAIADCGLRIAETIRGREQEKLPSFRRRGGRVFEAGVVLGLASFNFCLLKRTTPSAEAAATPPSKGGEFFVVNRGHCDTTFASE